MHDTYSCPSSKLQEKVMLLQHRKRRSVSVRTRRPGFVESDSMGQRALPYRNRGKPCGDHLLLEDV